LSVGSTELSNERRRRLGRRRERGLSRLAAVAALALAFAAHAGSAPSPTLERLVGQKIMTGIDGAAPDARLLARVRAGQVGGVILFGRNTTSIAQLEQTIAQLQAAAKAGGNPPLLIATDQEGGLVKRLPGPPDLAPAGMGTAAKARAEGTATGAYLRRLGIDVDLAPVLDTPYGPGSWLGTRAFSRDPRVNASLGPAFVAGLQSERVAATAKHFPGLGTARATTDTSDLVLTTSKAVLNGRLLPFRAAIDGGVDLVMVSNAGYKAFNATGAPAVLSRPIVVGLLRGQLGFHGVVISDSLEAPGPSARPATPLTASAIGVDLLLYTSEATSEAAYTKLLAGARAGFVPRPSLTGSWARIRALKQKLQ
jgi:beta-N-acetylhexosaminidase